MRTLGGGLAQLVEPGPLPRCLGQVRAPASMPAPALRPNLPGHREAETGRGPRRRRRCRRSRWWSWSWSAWPREGSGDRKRWSRRSPRSWLARGEQERLARTGLRKRTTDQRLRGRPRFDVRWPACMQAVQASLGLHRSSGAGPFCCTSVPPHPAVGRPCQRRAPPREAGGVGHVGGWERWQQQLENLPGDAVVPRSTTCTPPGPPKPLCCACRPWRLCRERVGRLCSSGSGPSRRACKNWRVTGAVAPNPQASRRGGGRGEESAFCRGQTGRGHVDRSARAAGGVRSVKAGAPPARQRVLS